MAVDNRRWLLGLAAALLTNISIATALECTGDALLDPVTVLACMYLPPAAYKPTTPGTPVVRNSASLCNDQDCPTPRCFYCSYCQPTTAVCACSAPGAAGSVLAAQANAIWNFTVSYAIENFTVPASSTLGNCLFSEACPVGANYAVANCSSVPPVVVVAVSPTAGPLSGGTLLVLNGTGLKAVTSVLVGSSLCDVASFRSWQTDDVVYCLLAGGQSVGAALNVSYTVAGASAAIVTPLVFTYSADPVLLGLDPLEVIESQLSVVVTGRNLEAAGRSFVVSRLVTVPENSSSTYYGPCSAVGSSGTVMSCDCPTYGVPGNDTVYDMYVYMDGFRNLSLVSGTGGTWSIPFTAYPDPTVDTFPSVGLLFVFDPDYGAENTGKNITVTGSGLSRVDASRYVIEIGNDTLCSVLSLDDATLVCTPSSLAQPGLGDNYTTYLNQNAPSMTVWINGTDYQQFVGYVMFYNRSNGYIILGVAFGALLLAVIVIVLGLVIYVKREQSMKRQKADAYQTK